MYWRIRQDDERQACLSQYLPSFQRSPSGPHGQDYQLRVLFKVYMRQLPSVKVCPSAPW